MRTPEISVVMSVFNGGGSLARTLRSVLGQANCDFEFIVINDGSTDSTANIIDQAARQDSRIVVKHQSNIGLTRSLIGGCALARGEFIARHDAGDESLPGRLAAQASRLRADRACVAVSCHTRFVGPKGEFLYETRIGEPALNEGLRNRSALPRGPTHHGSVMLRAECYRRAGEYREAFYFAQDLDLWTRMNELGPFGVVDQVLYQAELTAGSISGTQSQEQRKLASLIGKMAASRRVGRSDAALLQQAAAVTRRKAAIATRMAQGNYFIGSCLARRSPREAEPYFREALRQDPLHWRAWLRWAQVKVQS
jgi:glycosyltransferase involved in cell wall biosynthesis